ncbi:DUF4175 domain-containing protein [Henriciella litoralis]|uniref:DUF4175 domain-containing protein n=1 Tax=Henriciella litoralis TaxID=568102 RepID=UPI0009FF373D|nr:DUF4175 family protein [Henriciella litoralis]
MAELKRIPGIEPKIARTKRALWRLSAVRAFWPLLIILSVFVFLALTGLLDASTDKLAALSLIIFVVGVGVLGVLGWMRFRGPQRREAIDLLDRQSDLRPLSTLNDRPARPEAKGVALWRAHETRLTDAARRLQVPSFAGRWKEVDPFYLRYLVPAALFVLVLMTWNVAGERLQRAVNPDFGSLFGAETIRIEAWITPPRHTGKPPIFLQSGQDAVRVPAGSEVTVRAEAPSAPKLVVDASDERQSFRFDTTPEGAFEARAIISADSDISVTWWGDRATWQILASPDAPPEVEWVSTPELTPTDKTEFSWKTSDDYGVSKLELVLTRTDQSNGVEEAVEVQLPSIAPKEAEDTTAIDMTRNRWAGLEVSARLRATDGAGQASLSEPAVFILPEKLLLQPLARAIQDIRVTILREDGEYETVENENGEALEAGAVFTAATQRIGRAPPGIQRASLMIEAVTYEAPRYFEDISIYFALRHVEGMLQAASSTDEADTTEPILWAMALRAEYGSAADALRALQAARKALEEALRDGASEAEIQRRLEAFKQAAKNYMAARMAEALANGLEAPPDDTDGAQNGAGAGLGGSDFADMLDALSDLTETGATDQARQLLSDITNMLENLEFQQGNGSGDGMPGMPGEQGENDEDVPQEERELSDTLRELSDLLREQRELNDETLAEQRGERGPQPGQQPGEPQGPDGEGQDQPGANGEFGEEGTSLAERQDQLGDMIEEMLRRRGEDGEGAGAGELDENAMRAIERAQRRAADSLRDGNTMRAQRNQDDATDRLGELAQQLAGELDAARRERLGDEYGSSSDEVDPFGRPMGGVADGRDVNIPDEAERQRAKDILEELRRRYGDAADEEERDYLQRLLDRF